MARQCALAGVWRSGLYYRRRGESAETLELMRCLDEQYTRTPFYGVRRMTYGLGQQGYAVNVKRVRRQMGREAIYPKPRLLAPGPGHRVYPYRLREGFIYLVGVMDWFSRYVLAWGVSVSLEGAFCLAALEWALQRGHREIFNTDQGAQFTSEAFTHRLEASGITISMDGRWTTFSSSGCGGR